MPVINLDFTDRDYEQVCAAASRERLPLEFFARTAVLAHTISRPTTWTLVTSNAEGMSGLSDAAQELMKSRRGTSPDDNGYRANGCLWRHLTERAAVIAYPSAHYTSAGTFEFLFDRDGTAEILRAWSTTDGLTWKAGDADGQGSAHQRAIAVGNHRLGIPVD